MQHGASVLSLLQALPMRAAFVEAMLSLEKLLDVPTSRTDPDVLLQLLHYGQVAQTSRHDPASFEPGLSAVTHVQLLGEEWALRCIPETLYTWHHVRLMPRVLGISIVWMCVLIGLAVHAYHARSHICALETVHQGQEVAKQTKS